VTHVTCTTCLMRGRSRIASGTPTEVFVLAIPRKIMDR
jgi:hypothetical protein